MIIVLRGPSGSGKSTLASNLYAIGGGMQPLPSYTTRPRRASDQEHPGELTFVDNATFDEMKQSGEFMWTAKPFDKPYRYGTRGNDVATALNTGISIAVLTGDAPAILHGYTLGTGQKEKVVGFYLHIEDYVELRRRMEKDVSRHDIEQRLQSAFWENNDYKGTSVPYHGIDATQSKSGVLQTVLAILDQLSPNP